MAADRRAVSALLANAWRLHGTLAVDDQIALLQSGVSTVAAARDHITGFLGLLLREPAGDPPELWADLLSLAVAGDRNPAQTVHSLVEAALPGLQARGVAGLVCLTNDSWWQAALSGTGFVEADRVIGYVRSGRPPNSAGAAVATLRPVRASEADQVLAVNAAAFDPIWCYDRSTILSWLLTADHAVVAEVGGSIVGFALTTSSSHNELAHLVRIAVHPRFQGRGIGRQLLVDAAAFANEAGTGGLALNTQASNTTSRHLYETLGFRLSGPTVAVLVCRL